MLIAREDTPDRFMIVHQTESVRDCNGVHQRWEITRTWSDDELAEVGLYRVPDAIAPKGRTIASFTIERVDGIVQQVLMLGNLIEDLVAYLANKRWETETGGMLTSLGFGVLTDRESQGMITGAFNYIVNNPEQRVHWKTSPTDFIDLNVDQMTTLATEVAEHVQSCFSLEHSIIEQMMSGAITTAEQIDAAFTQALAPPQPEPPTEEETELTPK